MVGAMKVQPITCIGALSLILVLPAGAQFHNELPEGAGPYGRLMIGPTVPEAGKLISYGGFPGGDVDYTVGIAASAAIGYSFNRYLAADFEFGVISAYIDSVQGFYSYDSYLDNLPFVVNLSARYPSPGTLVTPYIGGGAGGTATTFSTDGFGDNFTVAYGTETEVVFAWQAFAGVNVALNKNMAVGLGYRYFACEDSSFSFPPYYPYYGPDLNIKFEGIRSHSVLISFNYRF
jgi:opacity protein-like surface antigen